MWTAHWVEYPFFVDLMAGGAGHAQRASDHIPDLAAFRRTAVYAEHFGPRGARYQANVALVSAGRIALVGLYRTRHDFTDGEIQALDMARLLLVQTLAYRTAVSQTNRLLQAQSSVVERRILTPRQEDVLALVATGATDYAIGRRLGISERTVRKHLEDIRQRLQVTNRVAAATWWLSVRSRRNPRT